MRIRCCRQRVGTQIAHPSTFCKTSPQRTSVSPNRYLPTNYRLFLLFALSRALPSSKHDSAIGPLASQVVLENKANVRRRWIGHGVVHFWQKGVLDLSLVPRTVSIFFGSCVGPGRRAFGGDIV